MKQGCPSPAPFHALVDYWLGELAPQREEEFEAHVLGCASCSSRLEELASLGAAIGAVSQRAPIRAVISPQLLEVMRKEGLPLREYRLAPGGAVACRVEAPEVLVVGRLQAPLAGVMRIDLLCGGEGGERVRYEDIPFEPAAGEVLVCPAPGARKRGALHLQLAAVDPGGGNHVLGDYSFHYGAGSG